jgi:hypothetical protein
MSSTTQGPPMIRSAFMDVSEEGGVGASGGGIGG